VSRIFDALTLVEDDVRESLASLMPAHLQEGIEASAGLEDESSAEAVEFLESKVSRGALLPGGFNPSVKTVRNVFILGFLTVGLVLLGVGRSFHSGSPFNKSPYGVGFESTIRPVNNIRITAASVGTISDIFVKVGDSVQKGQALLQMSDADAQLTLKQAKMELEAAEENLHKSGTRLADVNARLAVAQGQQQQVPTRQWRDSPERAQAAFDEAQTHYDRARELFSAGVVPKQELDSRTTELRVARDDLENSKRLAKASENLENQQTQQADLQAAVIHQQLQEEVKRATLKYQQAEQHLDGTMVRATQAGVLSEIPVRIGDRLPEGALLAELTQLNPMVAEVPVAATMIAGLHVGQSATVQLPTVPPRQVEGKIRTINPLPAANMTHTVEVQFENPTFLLLAGQPAEVRFGKP
jgi:hemolysin D